MIMSDAKIKEFENDLSTLLNRIWDNRVDAAADDLKDAIRSKRSLELYDLLVIFKYNLQHIYPMFTKDKSVYDIFKSSVDEFINKYKPKLNMKPFNYEEAKAGKPVCTRDGKPVRIICWDIKIPGKSIVGLVLDPKTGFESAYVYNNTGDLSNGSINDLMMASQKFTKYVNIYSRSNGCKSIGRSWYSSFEKAQKIGMKYDDYMYTAKLEWEE